MAKEIKTIYIVEDFYGGIVGAYYSEVDARAKLLEILAKAYRNIVFNSKTPERFDGYVDDMVYDLERFQNGDNYIEDIAQIYSVTLE